MMKLINKGDIIVLTMTIAVIIIASVYTSKNVDCNTEKIMFNSSSINESVSFEFCINNNEFLKNDLLLIDPIAVCEVNITSSAGCNETEYTCISNNTGRLCSLSMLPFINKIELSFTGNEG